MFIGCVMALSANAQITRIYESREYKQAIEQHTRTRQGLPGKAYWQNSSNYDINATFDPRKGEIWGIANIHYQNNSPDSLIYVVVKVMQNFYKKGAARQMEVPIVDITDGVHLDSVRYNGKLMSSNMRSERGTNVLLFLPDAIRSGQSADFSISYHLKMPLKEGIRTGAADSTSYFMGYWFPQMAVYDDIFGWDTDQYIGIPENYNDFSDYKVSLTLPGQYMIWATGKLENPEEMYPSDVLTKIRDSQTSNEVVHILTAKDWKTIRKKAPGTRTWKFVAHQVPDFAWATSDHYLWDGAAAKNPDPQHTCWVQAVYPAKAYNFDEVTGIAQKSIEIMSAGFPGIPYPYFEHITFNGGSGGGMEFPMMANNESVPDMMNTMLITAHEIAHNYFPFLMGINERKYGWFDETMTSMMEEYVNKKGYPSLRPRGLYSKSFFYYNFGGRDDDLPLMTETSNIMKEMTSIFNFYTKGPIAMEALQSLIGENHFNQYVKDFMFEWAGKHPTPYDLFYYINERYGQNLDWLWQHWFFDYGYADVGIASVKQSNQMLSIDITNEGGMPVPVRLKITYSDDSTREENVSISVWKENPEHYVLNIQNNKAIKKVSIDPQAFYDVNRDNDKFEVKH